MLSSSNALAMTLSPLNWDSLSTMFEFSSDYYKRVESIYLREAGAYLGSPLSVYFLASCFSAMSEASSLVRSSKSKSVDCLSLYLECSPNLCLIPLCILWDAFYPMLISDSVCNKLISWVWCFFFLFFLCFFSFFTSFLVASFSFASFFCFSDSVNFSSIAKKSPSNCPFSCSIWSSVFFY